MNEKMRVEPYGNGKYVVVARDGTLILLTDFWTAATIVWTINASRDKLLYSVISPEKAAPIE